MNIEPIAILVTALLQSVACLGVMLYRPGDKISADHAAIFPAGPTHRRGRQGNARVTDAVG
jgi:hypothetical protein